MRRSWPFTVELRITERTPVAVFKAPDGTWLVDGTGLPYAVGGVPHFLERDDVGVEAAEGLGDRGLPVLPGPESPPHVPGDDAQPRVDEIEWLHTSGSWLSRAS